MPAVTNEDVLRVEERVASGICANRNSVAVGNSTSSSVDRAMPSAALAEGSMEEVCVAVDAPVVAPGRRGWQERQASGTW